MSGDDTGSVRAIGSDGNPVRAVQGGPLPDPPIRWRRAPGWTDRILDDEVMVLGPGFEQLSFTGLAAPVWLVLDQPGSTGEVTRRISRRWPSRPALQEDVGTAISVLVAGGAVAEVEPGAARIWGVDDGGGVVEVVVARPVLSELERRWPLLGLRATADKPSGPVEARLGLGRTGLFVPDDLAELSDEPEETAWGLLEQSLTAVAVAQLDHLVAVHAAVIAHHGVAMLVPATSGAGKSTLTAAAARAGATVLSDEYALVDPDTGLVTGWPRSIRLRMPDGTEQRIDLAEMSEPLPVGLVASVTYDAGLESELGAGWEPVSAAEATLDLLANTIVARTRPDASLDAALAITRGARVVKGTRGDADHAIRALLDLLDQPGQAPDR